jgi:hypothetical protein
MPWGRAVGAAGDVLSNSRQPMNFASKIEFDWQKAARIAHEAGLSCETFCYLSPLSLG